ncbi:hypothetical protein [Clostridium bowmanii]|uniref:hypothetical protein n=1 Tax=Clostridium bowmanii TaxID=132925 RepID=UPI001C0BB6EA|nr:hypothetical protein [Clostridium bowmanii]MBU3189113.1 hypothetical protein [Clostridium bowmanii]MCA1073787.1 hypothetical protein [Clostridium bowmanii]
MLNKIPLLIYDLFGDKVEVMNYTKVYFQNKNVEGYVLHVEQHDRITSINEFDIEKREDKYYCTRKLFS